MERVRTLPLTWAQQSWMQVQALGEHDAWRHENGAIIQVPRHVSLPELSDVILELARNHPPLRGKLRRTASGIVQDILAADSLLKDTLGVYVVPSDVDLRAATERFRKEHATTSALNVLAAVQYHGRSRTSIGIALAHAFVDGWGAHVLERIVEQRLGGGRRTTPQSTLYDLLSFENSEAGRECSRRNIAELLRTATRAAELGALPERPAGRSGDQVDLLSIEHSNSWLPRVLLGLGGNSRVLRAAAMLALVFLAYCRWTGNRRSAVFQTPVSNRVEDSERDFVGFLMMRTWILAEWKPDETCRQFVRRMARRLVVALSHGRVEPAGAADELRRHGFSCPPQLYFNYFEPRDLPAHSGGTGIPWSDESSRRTMAPSGGVPFEYNVNVHPDRAFAVTKFDQEAFGTTDAGGFARHLKRLAVAVLDDPELVVGRACDLQLGVDVDLVDPP